MRTVSTAYSGMPSARSRICVVSSCGSPGASPAEKIVHGWLGQRLEEDRREVARRRAPTGVLLLQFGASECDDEERGGPRPLEQVLDEVEQRRVGPLHVLEDHDRRVHVCETLEEEAPGGEEVLAFEPRLPRAR